MYACKNYRRAHKQLHSKKKVCFEANFRDLSLSYRLSSACNVAFTLGVEKKCMGTGPADAVLNPAAIDSVEQSKI